MIATPVIVPAAPIVTVPSAVVVVPIPMPAAVLAKLTCAVEYPTPPVEIATDVIVPAAETNAVPAADTLSY